jgi:hypothetical protein
MIKSLVYPDSNPRPSQIRQIPLEIDYRPQVTCMHSAAQPQANDIFLIEPGQSGHTRKKYILTEEMTLTRPSLEPQMNTD